MCQQGKAGMGFQLQKFNYNQIQLFELQKFPIRSNKKIIGGLEQLKIDILIQFHLSQVRIAGQEFLFANLVWGFKALLGLNVKPLEQGYLG